MQDYDESGISLRLKTLFRVVLWYWAVNFFWIAKVASNDSSGMVQPLVRIVDLSNVNQLLSSAISDFI